MNTIQEKRISRKDLIESEQSWDEHSQDSDTELNFRNVLNKTLGSIKIDRPSRSPQLNNENIVRDDASEDGLEFRLFASESATTARVRVQSPDISQQSIGFVISERPRSYYFADGPSDDDLAAMKASALTGAQILELSKVPWPGSSLPWRVQVVFQKSGKVSRQPVLGHGLKDMLEPNLKRRRSRPNKKTRVAIRKRVVAQEKAKSESIEKEAAMKAKKSEKNKKNKMKRREKKRNEKKAAANEIPT